MRRPAILLVLVMTTSGCVSPEVFRATVKSGVRDVVVATAIVAVVSHAVRFLVARSFERRSRRADAPRTDAEQAVDSRWAETRRRR